MRAFNLMALDQDFQIVSLLNYTNLQWSRKYHEPGIFSVQIPLGQYDTRFAYLYTKDREEIGVVGQIFYSDENGYRSVNLSGFFLENELNRHIVYKNGVNNIKNAPGWIDFEGSAEDGAYHFFNSFKKVVFENEGKEMVSEIEMEAGTSRGRGKRIKHERSNEHLGNKIYHILKPSDMSYRTLYDFETNRKVFEVWMGKDRTQEQDVNNPVTFSTVYGNVKSPRVLIDNTEYRNACIVDCKADNLIHSQALSHAEDGEKHKFTHIASSTNKSDYSSEEMFRVALMADGSSGLSDWIRIINIEFDIFEGSYEYRKDFDLGDKCNIEIPEMGISATAVLIGCYEVVKKGVWSVTLEFGTPILKNRR